MQLERRFLSGIEEREGKLIGYAAVFNSPSKDLGRFVEVIEPGAFTRTLKDSPDVLALIDHDSSKVLGRTTAGTLRLEVDSHGLRVEIDPPDTTAARDLIESVKRGDVTGMSFAFRVSKRGERWDHSATVAKRHLLDVDLREVSVVTFPAYADTSIALRSLQESSDTRRMRLRLAEAE